MDFFKDTLYTLDHSYLRPRYSGYLDFQDNAGDFVRDYVMNGGDPKKTICKMNELYLRSKGKTLKLLDGILVLDFSQYLAGYPVQCAWLIWGQE